MCEAVIVMRAGQVVRCAGFSVIGSSGIVGWVEEVWLDEADAPAGVAIELLDERRVFLAVADIADFSADGFSLTMRPDARLLALELPRVVTADTNDGTLAATWKTTDEPVEIGNQGAVPMDRSAPALRLASSREGRPLWQVIAALYTFLVLLVTALIGIDFLIAYLVTGAPPY